MVDTIFVDLSAPQQSVVGKVLNRLYYRPVRYPHLSLLENSQGYPHNGGEHTLYFNIERKDALAFLSQLIDDFPDAIKELSYLYQDICRYKDAKSFSVKKSNPSLMIEQSE